MTPCETNSTQGHSSTCRDEDAEEAEGVREGAAEVEEGAEEVRVGVEVVAEDVVAAIREVDGDEEIEGRIIGRPWPKR